MKKQFILLVALLCTQAFLSAQILPSKQSDYSGYYKLCNEALTAKVNGDSLLSIDLYEKACELYYPFIDDLYELKECYKKTGNINKVSDVWKRMIITGFTKYEQSYFIDEVGQSRTEKEWIPKDERQIFEALNYDSLHQVFLQNNFSPKNKYLEAIVICDRFCHQLRTYYSEHPDIFDSSFRYLFPLCEYSDNVIWYFMGNASMKINGHLFVNLIRSEYLPSRKETIWWENEEFYVALLHGAIDLPYNEKDTFLSAMRQFVDFGYISPSDYATLYDHITRDKWGYGGYYGTAVAPELPPSDTSDPEKPMRYYHQFTMAEPYDIKNIDKLRVEIHLPPLWVSAKQLNRKLPEKYKP
ncbi:MAG: hypothetical protein LBQ31_06925 [Bacteroidales bacterium]|jgi:hypothetical protein|nr:hypothetical protein [Bacteroidales bacterium]